MPASTAATRLGRVARRGEDGAAAVFARLQKDPDLCRWHFAQQPLSEANARAFPEALLGALAKVDRAGDLAALAAWLTPAQLRALLTYRPFGARLAPSPGAVESAKPRG